MKKILLILSLLLFTAISCKQPPSEDEDKEVAIVYTEWSEGIATAFLVKNILEQELGYEVSLTMAEIGDAYRELASGKHELMLNAWLPETHKSYYAQYRDQLKDGGVLYENARTGLVVPADADTDKIPELETYTDTIYGIDPGAGIMQQTRNALEEYELDLHLKTGTEEEMLQLLDRKYKRKEPVVVTGWDPHLMLSLYELKFLEDPKAVYPGSENIHSMVHISVPEKQPRLMEFLSRFRLTRQQLLSLIQDVKNHPEGEDAGAREWMQENRLLISEWILNLPEFEEKPL